MTRKLFSVKLLTAIAATIAPLAMCQMPRECFYVMDVWGPEQAFKDDEDVLGISDLPLLMDKMTPDMRLNSIKMFQPSLDDEGDQGGIQLGLRLASPDQLNSIDLRFIGGGEAHSYLNGETKRDNDKEEEDSEHSGKKEPKSMVIGPDFDGITILTDEDDGLCNVVIHQGDNGTLPLFNLCSDDDEDVAQVTFYLPKETPLVGLHANED